MKRLKTKLLLTILSPLVLSLSWQNLANAETRRSTFTNGGFIDLTCTIDNNQSKIVTAKGALGNVKSSHISIANQDRTRWIKFKVPVSSNGNVNYTKKVVKSVTKVYLDGSVTHTDNTLEIVDGSIGALCN